MRNNGKINLIPIFVLVIGLALLVGAAFMLRGWQKSRRMSEGLRLGEIAYEQKDWKEAATQYGNYLSGDQNNIEILSKYAECLTKVRPVDSGRMMSAANAYRLIIRNDKTNTDAIGKASDIYIATRNPGEAEMVLKDAIQLLPDNEKIHEKYALSLAMQNKLDDLIELKNKYPDQLKAYYQFITQLCASQDKYATAIDLLKQVIEKYPKEVDAYQNLINLTIQKAYKENNGNINKASLYKEIEPIIQQATNTTPNDPKLHIMQANINIWNEKYSLVPSNLKQALDLANSDDYDLKIQVASLYANLERVQPDNPSFNGMIELAVKICNNITEQDHTNLKAWKALIGLVRLTNNKQQLLEYTDKALESLEKTERWDFIPTAVENYTSLDENDKASDLIAEVEKTDSMKGYVSYWKALVARNNNETFDEITLLNKAISQGYDNTLIKIQLANAYKRNNDISSAILHLRKVLDQNPNLRGVSLDLANLYIQSQQYTDAIETAQSILEVNPNDSAAIAIVLQATIQTVSADDLKDAQKPLYTNLLAEISKYIDKFENQLIPKRLMFSLALKAERLDDAETIVNQLKNDSSIGEDTIDSLLLSLYLNKSRVSRNSDNPDQAQKYQNMAMELLQKQQQANPDNVDLIISQASVYLSNDSYDEALSLIDNALNSAKSSANIRKLTFTKADITLAQESKNGTENPDQKSINIIDNYLNDNPDDIAALRKKLYYESIATDPAKADPIIAKIKDVEGNDGRIWKIETARQNLLKEELSKAEAQESITLLKDILTKNPYDHECAVNLANLYEKDNQLQLAANLWLEIHNRFLNNVQFADNAIRCLLRAGQSADAYGLLQQMLTQKPDNPRLLGYEAARLLEQNQPLQAQIVLEKLYSQDIANIRQKITLANLYYTRAIDPALESESDKQALIDSALKICDEIMAEDDYNFEAHSIKVGALLNMDRKADAKAICDNAISENPSAQSYLLRARFHFNNDDIEPTIEDLQKAVAFDDITETDYTNIVTLYSSLDDTTNALKYARLAMNAYPNNVAIARQTISLLLFPPANIELSEQEQSSSNEPKEDLIEQKMKNMAKEGKQLLDKVLKDNPNDILLKMLKSRFLIASGTKPELSTARNLLNGVVADQPNNIEAWLLLSQVEFARLQYQRAADVLSTAIQYNPDNPDLIIQKARAETEISPDLARSTLDKISTLASTDAGIGIRLASIYLSRNEPDQAIGLLDTAEKLTKDTNQLETIKILRILASYKQGNKQVMSDIDQILTNEPDNSDAFTAKIDMLVFDENWQAASDATNQWMQTNPDNIQSLLNIVSILLRQRESEQATNLIFEITDLVLAKEPDNIAALQVQATLSNLGQNIQQAIEKYRQILKYDPENTVAMNNLAWVLSEELNKPNEALQLVEKALEINPNYADLNDTTGVIYFRLGQYEKSVEVLNQAIALYNNNAPELVNTFFHIGRSQYMAGNKVEAGKFLQRAKEFNDTAKTLSEKDIQSIDEMLNSN